MANASPAKKLQDTVHGLSEATRWGQLNTAVRMVEPSYRAKFMQYHQNWGAGIQVADAEVVILEMTPDHEQATAVVAYQWYLYDNMSLRQTVVRQIWALQEGGYGLMSERIVQGDPELFGLDAEAVATASVRLLGDPTDY
jgi:hypothetical protein